MIKKSSTKPIGATSFKETAFGVISRKRLFALELEGTKKGLEFVKSVVAGKQEIEITPELILEIHKRSFGYIFPDWAGKYRTIRVEFSGKETILPYQVPEQIYNLCADLKIRLANIRSNVRDFISTAVNLLAWFQHRFVWIHPFPDYNGRTARILTILILFKLNLPAIEIKAEMGKDRKKYLEAMYAADEGNYEKLENLVSKALIEALHKSGEFLEKKKFVIKSFN